MKWAVAFHGKKKVYTGHWPKHEGKAKCMAQLLKNYGWCFPPVPVVDMGAYYQALDGSHRILACRMLGWSPEIVVVDMRMNPAQPIPKGWVEIVNAPLVHDRTIRGYGLLPKPKDQHIGVVLDEDREILRPEYVDWLFRLLLQLTRKIRILQKG